jgi:uncharacterized protein
MLHRDMASITVRVTPRSSRTAVERGPSGLTIRVRAVPERGHATDEAAAALADALRVPRTDVRLRAGARSRTKVFDVRGLSPAELQERVSAL